MTTIHLEDDELRGAAQAARCAAVMAEKDAEKQRNCTTRALFDGQARRYMSNR